MPRVRFGQVHVYNNFYDVRNTPKYQYSWGVGIESAIYAEENFFLAPRSFTPDQILDRFNGTALSASGTLLVGPPVRNPVDVIAAWNASNDPDPRRGCGLGAGVELSVVAGVDHAVNGTAVRGTDVLVRPALS